MSTLLAALKALWDFILSAITDFFIWLRKPGSKIKLVAAVLAFLLSIAAMRAWQAEQAIVVLTQQCETDKGVLNQGITDRDAKFAKTEADYKAERDQRNAQILRAQKLQLEAERRAKLAEQSLSNFRTEYGRKTPACTQALTSLKAACPALEDF